MRLDRLEIVGFKSFSERAELAFDQGVTAIVGPNGCGKSNVADAITWVLGEQSAKSLRGDRMEDVIFNGSDARKAGAAAEVRLRLSGLPQPRVGEAAVPQEPAAGGAVGDANGHGRSSHAANGNGNGHTNGNGHHLTDEIEAFVRDVDVTRRLYRSGESEYLINGEVCRLRDVHELLMDTGLGAKAYAIIEQGKIGMILSSRPADRRQLIEEAAGVTKYRSRRRAAELKLDAAQQNLTRVDDIVFEVEKQRGVLKRQAAKARRYTRLRDELRRWEKVLLARRYRELAEHIRVARVRLEETREEERLAAGRVAEAEATLSRLRIEQAEADARAGGIRERAHAAELDINRRQQQLEFDRQQVETLGTRLEEVAAEIDDLGQRREPNRIALEARQAAVVEAERARDEAAAALASAGEALRGAQQRLEVLEADVDAARQETFNAANAITAMRHAASHAEAQRAAVAERLGRLAVEIADLDRERTAAEAQHSEATGALVRARDAMQQVDLDRAARESALATARTELDERLRRLRVREQDLAGLGARLASLEELAAGHGDFDDAARVVLAEANGKVSQQGAVADYLEVDGPYERAVEACLGDLLQHVIVERHDQAAAGLALVREADAGRCGFVVIDPGSNGHHPGSALGIAGSTPVSSLVRISGPYAATIRQVLPEAYVADTFEQAAEVARQTSAPVATLAGDVFRGRHLVSGGARAAARGILQTRREIKELGARVAAEREALSRLGVDVSALELAVAEAASAIANLEAEHHRLEKVIIAHEAQASRAADDRARLGRKADTVGMERRQADEERRALDARLEETVASIERLQGERQAADDRLGSAQQRLATARAEAEDLSKQAAAAGAAHAGLVERTAAVAAEVQRLEEGARELEQRIAARTTEMEQTRTRRAGLQQAVVDGQRSVDDGLFALDALRQELRGADEALGGLREQVETQEAGIRTARQVLESVRGRLSELDVVRATAESDLSHLAQTAVDTVQASLDEVLAAVEAMEAAGETQPDAAAIRAEEPDADADEGETAQAGAVPADAPQASAGSMSAEEAIVALKGKIDRLGPVNMIAIEQYDELETRHAFLTTQRQDLVDSIAQTSEAIRRIDETTKARFREAFAAIQHNFQETFTTLFGGGHAGLSLLDDNDPLESGIDIVASPPGKRLQSVQLLSGGEKALTAIALMFAIFKYKPSPFCVLDEIDAPLDDANVGRFVEMLRKMLDRTQFILITHNRRTMEIADRLYGVTMEEPGVSKLISLQLN
ncbi:MAG: chromosome segregation protein SMC [Acidimicrobiia bacterium]|nr:chromosome segregation protein SMC [Acidimicrobiia bacterium]